MRSMSSLKLVWFITLAGLAAACGAPASTPIAQVTATPTVTPAPPPAPSSTPAPLPDPFVEQRQQMVEHQIRDRDISDEAVLATMRAVPRHLFVPADYLDQAYEDHPLPIGFGQTISQPFIVALMTDLIDLQPGERVLEIGTGSGYQAAVLAGLTAEVYTIEIIPELAARAQQTFDKLGYEHITAKQGDGYYGWTEYAPFDAIVVTAAPDHVPQPLVNQLADGGKMVIPIGPPGGYQSLWLLERQGDKVIRSNWGGVLFVPLTRQ
ncbi:MAG: protein-L-isoaspartate(D-aspartate) O-methyltransferase [Chloroflexota bacterium]